MSTTAKKKYRKIGFSRSVNILRDNSARFVYLPTPNAREVFDQIVSNYHDGTRSFSVVGAYGTGKSAFLWAFERTVNKTESHLAELNGEFKPLKGFEFISIVGSYGSFIANFAKALGVRQKRILDSIDVIDILDDKYRKLRQRKLGLAIVVDEFGKFLEYASKFSPEKELYFVQQLAEFANDPTKEILFVTTLHQDFNGYAVALNKSQRNEWDKVKGRLKEVPFNEPVEQLLFLAAERLSRLEIGKKNAGFDRLFRAIQKANAFPLRDYFTPVIAEQLLPFDILSAAVLTLALQKYGQNERSLFSFIESSDRFGLKDFRYQDPFFNLSLIYDYLLHNFYPLLTSKFNPHYTQWATMRNAIERVENLLSEEVAGAVKIVKSIGLLNIFCNAGAKIDKDFLQCYAELALSIRNASALIEKLESLKIIRFVRHSSKYVVFEGTDVDIEMAIDDAGVKVDTATSVVTLLEKHFDLPVMIARAASYETGTPRLFSFHLSEKPVVLTPRGEIDGYINLIISEVINEKDVKDFSSSCSEAVLFGRFANSAEIRRLLFEIEKVQAARIEHLSDKVVVKELDGLLQHQKKLLNQFVLESLYSKESALSWYFKGMKYTIDDRRSLNQLLSLICKTIYPDAPVFRNEMVNKTKLSGSISTARRNLLRQLVLHWTQPDLAFEPNKFPPEKTIYLTLLRETGMHRAADETWELSAPTDASYGPIWRAAADFLESTRTGRRCVKELVEIYLAPPFKLKQGFIDFWLPIALFIQRDEYALYGPDGFIPQLSEETLDLVGKNPDMFHVKAFNIQGVRLDLFNKYRALLNQSLTKKLSKTAFIDTIRPFLTFYRQLPLYAKKTSRLSKPAVALREAIAISKDPEETFFESLPQAMGYNMLQLQKNLSDLNAYVHGLQSCIRELRTCYDELLNRFEQFLITITYCEEASFPAYKDRLQARFEAIQEHLLLPKQRAFLQRVQSSIDDRTSWLNSVCQACIQKSLDSMEDSDEKLLYAKTEELIHEMDNLCEINRYALTENSDEVIKVEVTSLIEGIRKKLVRFPKNGDSRIEQLEGELRSRLTEDRYKNTAALLKLLREQLDGK